MVLFYMLILILVLQEPLNVPYQVHCCLTELFFSTDNKIFPQFRFSKDEPVNFSWSLKDKELLILVI